MKILSRIRMNKNHVFVRVYLRGIFSQLRLCIVIFKKTSQFNKYPRVKKVFLFFYGFIYNLQSTIELLEIIS